MGKKGVSIASRLMLQNLQECSRSKKELKQALKLAKPSLKKKHRKRALKYLIASGDVEKGEKGYRISRKRASMPASRILSNSTKLPDSILRSQKQSVEPAIPIGMKMKAAKSKKEVKFVNEPSGDIDDEIARLEMELMNDTDDSQGSSDVDEISDTNSVNGDHKTAILSLSSFANDRIETLPSACLPVPGKYSLSKKKLKPKNNPVIHEKSGLQKAVEEVLGGYTARSSERIPFYCRFCSKQYENETTFYQHKASDFHKTAVALERKATYCKLCRKQFTSPIQMKEHLSSRPHKQRLQFVRTRQKGPHYR